MAPERTYNAQVVEEFRANEGRVGGPFEGRPLLLLHHFGARTGVERVTPLAYQTVGDGFAIFASDGGSDLNPSWYHNLLAHPEVTVEVGTATISVSVREAEGLEREEIWARQKEIRPAFADYETRTSRRIPVLVLELIP
jgi:deazaflavin-dependent oxidoreductase (nitroreductase family)